jgi:hypothetical protein
MEDSQNRYDAFKSKLTTDIQAQKTIDKIIIEMQTSTTKSPDPPNNILPNIGVLDRVIKSSDKYNKDIIQKAENLKSITSSFITIIKTSSVNCFKLQNAIIDTCLFQSMDESNGQSTFIDMDTKRNELQLMIEKLKKSAAPTATAAPTASVFPPSPTAAPESPAPNSNPMVVKSTTADAIAELDKIAKSPQQQQEQQQVTITDPMGDEGPRLQHTNDGDVMVNESVEENNEEMQEVVPDSRPPPPTPPPNDGDGDPGETKDTPASPSDDDTCGGIENLCFLSNTISRLKFDCVSSLQIMGALNLANLNLNDMSYLEYKSAIDSVPNYENIMDDEDELVQQIAYENSKNTDGNVEGDSTFDPVTGDSPNTIAARNTEIYGGYCLQADLLPLLQFTETVRNDAKNNCKLHKILTDMRDIMKCAFGIPEDEFHMKPPFSYIRLYDNIDLVELDTKSLFPKFSFNILSVKSDMLLQTRLLAGRENGMGFFLNDYVGSALQPYFDSIISSGFAKVKIIPPADTSHLWQIKLRVLKTDFIFISLQIINVKQEYFATVDRGTDSKGMHFYVDQIYNTISTLPTTYAVGADVMADSINIEQRILEDYNKALNLCFSLYNKCLSKDFNALCSLSELDGIIAEMLIMNKDDPKSCKIFTTYIEYFLTNLVDTYINVKKQYFYLGLYNLLVSISQKIYTPETKAYEKLFDSNPGKNIFFDSMHIIKEAVIKANAPCRTNPPSGATSATESVETEMSEPIRFAMGGGKLYSLYQKALNSMHPIKFSFLCPAFIAAEHSNTIAIVKILHDFQNNTFIQQYLQSRNKENIQLREKINQLFLLKIQEKSLMDSGIPNVFLSEMITILGIELKNQKIFSDLKNKLTSLSSANPTDYASKIQIILELSTVLPVLPVLPIIDDINRPLYDLYENVTITFLNFFIDYDINFIKYLLLNFESIRCHYNNNLLLASMSETVNPAADADFGMFYEDTALGATSCMTVCMILQLALKDLIYQNVISERYLDPWIGSDIDIGNSCIGTPPVTLSSLRIVINNSVPFYNDILPETGSPYPGCITSILTGLKLAELINVKATISPFDFVQKGSLPAYIKHILEAVNTFGMLYTYKRGEDNIKIDITRITSDQINRIAKGLSDYCMITDECCSTPLKGIFDIFYTLFIIENFANRALVTQKINKELKRVAICAKVLFLHYKLLDPSSQNIEIQDMLNILLEMCSFSFSEPDFSLNNESQMIYIMNKYVEFVNMIAYFALQSPTFLFFCSLPTFEQPRTFTGIETIFNNLLYNSSMSTYTVNSISELTSQLTECIPCVLDVLKRSDPSILQMLNNNKQYCAECDAMNKASGRIILSSAYQSVLWSKKNYKTISKTQPRRDVSGLYDLLFPNKDLIQNDYFKDFIKVFIDNILEQCKFSDTNKDGNPIEVKIRDIFNLDKIQGITVNKPDVFIIDPTTNRPKIDPTTGNNTLQSFSRQLQFLFWFLTSVFGVKTKSKSTKIQALTRKYLSLIMELFPNPLVSKESRNTIPDLFGYNITIENLQPPSASPSPTDSPSCRGMNKGQIPPYYLFLAYDSFVAPMAYDKYDDYAKNHLKDTEKDPYPSGINRFGVSCDVILYDGGIAIDPYTPVMDFILTDLSGRFEKLPAGISKIIAVSEKMRGVLLNFLSCCQNPVNPASVQKYLCSLSEDSFADILYVPGSHDARKFFELKPEERTPWLRYLIYKIRISKNVVDDSTGRPDNPDPNDRFFCIKLLFLLIKYLILPDISPILPDISPILPDISSGTPCNNILTEELLRGLPPLTEPDKESLTEKINKYYDKCGQIERQQKVNALNADRKEITLSAVCALPKKKSDASKVSETFVEKFQSAITEAEATVKKETKETKESVKSSSTKKLRPSGESASSEPVKSSLTPEQQAIDAAETEAAAGVVSQLLQNLLVPKQKRTKKSTKKKQGNDVSAVAPSAPPPPPPASNKRRAVAPPSTATSPSAPSAPAFGAPASSSSTILFTQLNQPPTSTFEAPVFPPAASPVAFGVPLASQSFGVQFGTPFTFQPQLQSFGAPAQLSPFGASQAQIGAPAAFSSSSPPPPSAPALTSPAPAFSSSSPPPSSAAYSAAPAQPATFGSPPTPFGAPAQPAPFVASQAQIGAPAQPAPFVASQAQIGAPAAFSSSSSPPSSAPASQALPSAPASQAQIGAPAAFSSSSSPPSSAPASQALPSAPASQAPPSEPEPQPSAPKLQQQIRVSKQSLANRQEGDKKTELRATKRLEPEQPQQYSVDLRDVNTNLRDVNIKGSKRRANNTDTFQGGSPTFSIPTPSKTRKSHQRKRSHSSNKSTFKRRKYIAE